MTQARDVYSKAGRYLGTAEQFSHWPTMPLEQVDALFGSAVRGQVDHSQVFHRLPCALRWNEGIETVKFGDADFYGRLTAEWGANMYSIGSEPLTLEHIIE